MKIQILDRYEPSSDWHEIYANGELMFEGEVGVQVQLQAFVDWLSRQPEIEVDVRASLVEYVQKEGEEFMPPLRVMTGETYWSDWENAERE